MCGNPLEATSAQPPVSEPATTDRSDAVVGKPFIVSTTASTDLSSKTMNSRVAVPSTTMASSTHTAYPSSLKPREEEVYHGQTLQEVAPAPLDPTDEPVFASKAHTEEIVGAEPRYHDPEAERALEESTAEHEAYIPPPSETHSAGSILGLSAPSISTPDETDPESVRGRNSFLYIEDPPASSRSGDVSGPSFLGLGAEYVAEEETPRGGGRKWLLLAILAIFAVLAVLEWRASQNGDSTNPMEVLHLKLPTKKGQGQVQVMPSQADANPNPPATNDTSSASPNSNSPSASAGKPDLIADQSGAPAKTATDQAVPPASSSSNPPAQSAPDTKKADSVPPSTSANKSNTVETDLSTSPAPPKETATATPPPAAAPSKPAPRAETNHTPAKPVASKPVPQPAAPTESDASLNAGSAELQKGIAAGANEVGRMWLWKATSKGNGEAPVVLAEMYAQGRGVPKDCDQAMIILKAAAKKANPRARSKLGSMYAAGECVQRDRVQAYKWMSAALEANPGSEWLEKNRETLLKEMTPAERQRASR